MGERPQFNGDPCSGKCGLRGGEVVSNADTPGRKRRRSGRVTMLPVTFRCSDRAAADGPARAGQEIRMPDRDERTARASAGAER
jgi:hypothetical protein